jgi:predicted nucleotidyltransferase
MTDKLPVIELHSELNSKLWDDQNQLRPEVNVALLRIAKEFYQFLEFDAPLMDVQITGSQANYNYTDLSDIDLHLIVPFRDVSCDEPVEDLFDTKRKLWKLRHDINIHNIPVEVYVEDEDKPVNGSTYSLLKDQWLRRPEKRIAHWDEGEVSEQTLEWLKDIKEAVASQDLKTVEGAIDMLRNYRQQGLKISGEFGTPNLVFKNLRNLGAVAILMQAKVKLTDIDLSI